MATAGQLGVVSFQNPQALKRVGGNLLTVSEDSGPPVPVGDGVDIRAGYLESSNVSIIDEMQSLIFARAGFDANANVAKASDEMLGSLLDILSTFLQKLECIYSELDNLNPIHLKLLYCLA